ncbi:type II toxin-antitoxin system Phd/YefM family antitoxin [Candidatus Roizmanbacteria bacterium]|nr:type II toxin-antitoxin system Phd/YefM family antitoxin [Candidatus Roizmanbacteria bacterium]
MLNPATIKTVSDLRSDTLSLLRSAQGADEPIYIFYRTKPQAALIGIEELQNLMDEIDDLKNALEVLKRQKDSKRKLTSWKKIKKDLNLP